ncbi:MAG: glycine--tRNA ligase [Candidatus Aenigmatarchaeota archaeon]
MAKDAKGGNPKKAGAKETKAMDGTELFDNIMSIAKRRGFFYPAAEIHTPIAGFWSFGPLGSAMKRRIENMWRDAFVKEEGYYEVEGANILPAAVFSASGHLEGFTDPLVQCKRCHSMHRADKLIEQASGIFVPERTAAEEMDKMIADNNIKCPDCGGQLADTRLFNMMFDVKIGAAEPRETAYLRPETCQINFIDFANVYRAMRAKLPFGIAQIGRSFRNEISPRQGLLRQREFTQAEMEVFFNPADKKFARFAEVKNYKLNVQRSGSDKVEHVTAGELVKKGIVKHELIAYYLAKIQKFVNSLGIPLECIRLREQDKKERPFYAEAAFDCEVKTAFGWVEVAANHYRTDYDLGSHAKATGKDLTATLDSGEKVVPHVWEISEGVDRTLFCVMMQAYVDDKKRGWEWLALEPKVAPFAAAVFPLVSKDGLAEKANEVHAALAKCYDVLFDESGSIGKRYARADEVGIPFCVTVDYDTLKDGTVTLRDRNTTTQRRVKIDGLASALWELVFCAADFEKLGTPLK